MQSYPTTVFNEKYDILGGQNSLTLLYIFRGSRPHPRIYAPGYHFHLHVLRGNILLFDSEFGEIHVNSYATDKKTNDTYSFLHKVFF